MGTVVPDRTEGQHTGLKGSTAQACEALSCVFGNREAGGRLALGRGHGQAWVLEITLLAVRPTWGEPDPRKPGPFFRCTHTRPQ